MYWEQFAGGNSISRLRQKLKDGILRSGKPILISGKSIQSLALHCAEPFIYE